MVSEKKSVHPNKSKYGHIEEKEVINYTLTPEDVFKLGLKNEGLESPIDISFDILTVATLPRLEWVNFQESPKRMKITNSGTTVILSAKWNGPRPFVIHGPLPGRYVFTQLHFHWGSNSEEGSEHTFNGKSCLLVLHSQMDIKECICECSTRRQLLPLEVHMMFFKNTYLSLETAMKKYDGTVTVAYLFTETDNEDLDFILSALSKVQKPLTSCHLELFPLSTFLHSFFGDYFMYWGNVDDRSILWIVSRTPIGISLRQLCLFYSLTGPNSNPIKKNFRAIKELNHRMVYHINPSKHRSSLLLKLPSDPIMKKLNEGHLKTPPVTVVNQVELRYPNYIADAHAPVNNPYRPASSPTEKEHRREEIIAENSDVDCKRPRQTANENPLKYVRSLQHTMEHSKNTAENDKPASKLELRTKSQIKLQLATALLNLEKEEGSDYHYLEKYIESKFDSTTQMPCFDVASESSIQSQNAVLQPNVRSLQMSCNVYEICRNTVMTVRKDKSKSAINSMPGVPSPGDESDSARDSIAGSVKSGWTPANSLSDREEPQEAALPKRRPMSSREEKWSRLEQKNLGNSRWQQRVAPLRPLKQQSRKESPARVESVNRSLQLNNLPIDKSKRIFPDSNSNFKTVDGSKARLRSQLKKSMSKLIKLRGSASIDITGKQRATDISSRPAWRY